MFQSDLTVVRVASTKPVLVMSVQQRQYGSPFFSAIVPSEEQYTVPTTIVYQWNRYSNNVLQYDTYIWTVVLVTKIQSSMRYI